MAVMLLGDTAAALIGRRFGRHKTVNGKSWEGVIAFLAAGYTGCALFLLISGMPSVFYFWGAVSVFPAAAVELFEKQLHIDARCYRACPLRSPLFQLTSPSYAGIKLTGPDKIKELNSFFSPRIHPILSIAP